MTTHVEWAAIAHGGLRYFGSISASVSHDIRNRLAVINEKAGLLEDLAAMMVEGRAVDPERIRTQAHKVHQQVHLTNQVIRDLNTFAHTVDVLHKPTNVSEILRLVAGLSARKFAAANAAVDTSGLPERIVLNTMPFFLSTVIGHCLDIAVRTVDDTSTITVAADSVEIGVSIHFGHVTALDRVTDLLGPDPAIAALLDLLGGYISIDHERSELVLEVSDLGHHEDGGQS